MRPEPSVTVVLPAFNAASFISEALGSIARQTRPPQEVIVVDDGSTDGTSEVVKTHHPGVRYLYQDHSGPSGARNRGIKAATGEILAWLDADDIWQPFLLERLLARLEARPRVEIVVGLLQSFASDHGHLTITSPPTAAYSLGAAVVRREVFDRIGDFDTHLRYAEDWDWFFRARDRGVGMALVDSPVYLYRRHAGNLTQGNQVERKAATMQVLRRSLERRRVMSPSEVDLLPLHGLLEGDPGRGEGRPA